MPGCGCRQLRLRGYSEQHQRVDSLLRLADWHNEWLLEFGYIVMVTTCPGSRHHRDLLFHGRQPLTPSQKTCAEIADSGCLFSVTCACGKHSHYMNYYWDIFLE